MVDEISDQDLTPRTAPVLIGHETAEKTLLDSFNSKRLHHAWLITGPRGIGKATLAFRFARFLLKNAKDDEGQGAGLFGEPLPVNPFTSLDVALDDPVVRRINVGAHGDLLCIEREFDEKKNRHKGVIGVDRVRGISGYLSKTASEGGWRVVIVDAADEMNRNAANAVLKVLEEPPAKAILLLLAHNPGKLLPTIRSRCRVLGLDTLSDQQIVTLMQRYVPESSRDEAEKLARIAEGSFGRALSLYQEGGLDLYQQLTSLLATLPALDTEKLHKLADKMSTSGADNAFRTLGDLFVWWLGRLISQGARGISKSFGLDHNEVVIIQEILVRCDIQTLIQVWQKITMIFEQGQSGNLDRKQAVLSAFLALEGAVRK